MFEFCSLLRAVGFSIKTVLILKKTTGNQNSCKSDGLCPPWPFRVQLIPEWVLDGVMASRWVPWGVMAWHQEWVPEGDSDGILI